jgi:hypothetical protein
MALTAFTGTIVSSVLNGNFDDDAAVLAANAIEGSKDATLVLRVVSLANTNPGSTELRDRTMAWVAPDNMQVRIAFLRVTDGTASRVVTGTLEVDSGDDDFLTGNTVALSVTSVIGTVDSRTAGDEDYRTGVPWLRVFKGVRYRLTVENTSAATTVTGPVQLAVQVRSERRRA